MNLEGEGSPFTKTDQVPKGASGGGGLGNDRAEMGDTTLTNTEMPQPPAHQGRVHCPTV